ncbi:MAG: tetratricopeptide (TPR) repeat protein [Kiritimatiellia bacterium]|jgi:tetratricopeptide (TPR) repeat protein
MMLRFQVVLLAIWLAQQVSVAQVENAQNFSNAPKEGLAAPSVRSVDDGKAEVPLNIRQIVDSVDVKPLSQLPMQLPKELKMTREQIARDQQRLKGSTLLNSQNYAQAIVAFQEILDVDPQDKHARFGLATALVETKRYDEAIVIFNQLIEEFPNDYFAKNNLAWLYATSKNPEFRNAEKAIHLAQDALILAPADYHVWSTLSEGYYLSGQYGKSLRAANIALALGERDARAASHLLTEYKAQVRKCSKYAKAMSILE